MAKSLSLLLIVFTSILVAGIYGILHDQFTYSISEEYYTRFKFIQFGIIEEEQTTQVENPRIGVCIVGFFATWWVGFWIGLVLGLVGLVHSSWKRMVLITYKAMVIALIVSFLIGLLGLGYGYLFLSGSPRESLSNWFIPNNLSDFKSFVAVGSMHNFSYMGGLLGLLFATCFSLMKSRRSLT